MIKTFPITSDIELSFLGPDFEEGPLPAVFYFALSQEESLGQDPYNQPAVFLSQYPMRIFSMTLPAHGPGLPATQALSVWAQEIKRNHDPISEFVEKVLTAVHFLERHEVLIPLKVATMGLSRGAFIATHVAARLPLVSYILGFAPLIDLGFSKDFSEVRHHSLVESLNLVHLIPKLTDRHLRFYIGNHDVLVGTEICFHFIHQLSQVAFEHKIRSPQAELIIGPSIGHKGHGTAKEVFENGAGWLAKKLGFPHVFL
jgi:esterase FrsA